MPFAVRLQVFVRRSTTLSAFLKGKKWLLWGDGDGPCNSQAKQEADLHLCAVSPLVASSRRAPIAERRWALLACLTVHTASHCAEREIIRLSEPFGMTFTKRCLWCNLLFLIIIAASQTYRQLNLILNRKLPRSKEENWTCAKFQIYTVPVYVSTLRMKMPTLVLFSQRTFRILMDLYVAIGVWESESR